MYPVVRSIAQIFECQTHQPFEINNLLFGQERKHPVVQYFHTEIVFHFLLCANS